LLAEVTDSKAIVDLVGSGTGFQCVDHRQDADATFEFDARPIRHQIATAFSERIF
jgi:hypothetical protein